MSKEKHHHHRHRHLNGRYLLTLGALALIAVSGYELWIRLEDFWAWTAGIRHLSQVRGNSFIQDLAIVFEAPEMRQLGYKMLFLMLTVIFALVCLLRRNRAAGAWVLMILDAIVTGAGALLGLYSFNLSNWAQTLKLIPLVMIFVGLIVNLVHRSMLINQRKKRHREPSHDRHGGHHEHSHDRDGRDAE